jgi:hypothetical protein
MYVFIQMLAVISMCMMVVITGFAPVARRTVPLTIHTLKPFQSLSPGHSTFNFRLFADNDGKKITRDKEGEFFESEVR